jgi:hypothetical protein
MRQFWTQRKKPAAVVAVQCIALLVALSLALFVVRDSVFRNVHSSIDLLTQSARSVATKHGFVLLVMVDNRPLQRTLQSANLLSLAAASNYLYAKRHGYGFISYRLTDMYCLHPLLEIARYDGWCKLPALWQAVTDNHPGYQFIVYLDSDCVIIEQERRFEDFVEALSDLRRFGKSPYVADMTLLSDYFADPICRTGYAITAFILLRSSANSERFVRRWWVSWCCHSSCDLTRRDVYVDGARRHPTA